MTFLRSLIIVALLFSCKGHKDSAYLKAKADHDARMKILLILPEPFYDKVPDSMRQWVPVFKRVFVDDQRYRIIGYGFTKSELKEQNVLDSQNLQIVTKYLDKYRWPILNDIGFVGQKAVAMVIQHAPLRIQEQYYPKLIESCKRDSLLFETVALLEDRINLRNNRLQYYGTQAKKYKGSMILYPVHNLDSIEYYRRRIRLIPLKEYLARLKINWDTLQYKNHLPELIKAFKISDSVGLHYNL